MALKDILKKELFLIYVIKIGFDHKGRAMYEFLFSDTIEGVWGDDWEVVPACSNPQPPDNEFVKLVGSLKNEINIEVVQNSEAFGVCDAVDNVIALAWEVDTDNEEINNRLVFHFGETKKMVEDKLYKRDVILNYE